VKPAAAVTHADVAAYAGDGVVCLRQVFAPEWIELLRAGFARVLAEPTEARAEHGRRAGERFFHDANTWARVPEFRRFALESPAASIAARLMGATRLNFYGDHVFAKEPNSPQSVTPWHHDYPYLRVTGEQVCSVWVPLQRVTAESGGMRFARGSHRWGKVYRPVRFTTGEEFGTEEFADSVPAIDADPARYPVVSFDLEPGDCTVHHGRTLHAAGGNRTASLPRRAVSFRYAGDDARYAEHRHQPQFTRFATGLKPGEPLGGSHYPLVLDTEGPRGRVLQAEADAGT